MKRYERVVDAQNSAFGHLRTLRLIKTSRDTFYTVKGITMVCIEVRHIFPVSVEKAFAYITDTKNWPEYWPDFVGMSEQGTIPWGNKGARVQVVIKLLNCPTALNIELQSFEENALVKYVSRQQGLPDIRHERHFRQTDAGCEFRLVVAYVPRNGLKGIFDRLLLKRSIINALNKTLLKQESILCAA